MDSKWNCSFLWMFAMYSIRTMNDMKHKKAEKLFSIDKQNHSTYKYKSGKI